jgi:hypothetical protein
VVETGQVVPVRKASPSSVIGRKNRSIAWGLLTGVMVIVGRLAPFRLAPGRTRANDWTRLLAFDPAAAKNGCACTAPFSSYWAAIDATSSRFSDSL